MIILSLTRVNLYFNKYCLKYYTLLIYFFQFEFKNQRHYEELGEAVTGFEAFQKYFLNIVFYAYFLFTKAYMETWQNTSNFFNIIIVDKPTPLVTRKFLVCVAFVAKRSALRSFSLKQFGFLNCFA